MRTLSLYTLLTAFAAVPFAHASESFDQTVRPFLSANCQKCHNTKESSGGVNFEQFASPAALPLEKTAYVLQMGQMPPDGAPKPPKPQVDAVVAVLNRELAKANVESRASAEPPSHDWVTWNADPERTGWARGENKLTKANASGIDLLWKTQLDATVTRTNPYATLTDPVVVDGVSTKEGPKSLVYVASGENNVYAIDAESGKVFWERKFPNTIKPVSPPTGTCPNNLNATPTIDKKTGILYVLTNDGKLRGLGLADGDDRMAPSEFVTPFSRNWSLNLIDGLVYTSSSRGCGNAISSITAMDVKNPNHPVMRFFPSTGKASGPWGRGGIVGGPFGVFAQTADGAYDPAAGRFGNTMLSLTKDLRLTDSYTPSNLDYLNKKDLDLGSASPVVFPFENWTLVAASAKEGVIYLLDATDLGGSDHRVPLYVSPRYGNDVVRFGFTGVWGAMSTWVDAQGQRWLLVPMLGPPAKDTVAQFKVQNGPVVNGSVMAFRVKVQDGKPALEPAWMSHDLDLPGIPAVANGVVYVLANGERARDKLMGPRPQRVPGQPFRFNAPKNAINAGEPGADRDAAWLAIQKGPDGQVPGKRFEGGIDLTHAVLSALDASTGKEIYSSGEAIDSWNHYGGLALSNGKLFVSTYDARVFAFGLKK